MTDHQTPDPNAMRRPHQLYTTGVVSEQNWDSGPYAYDGSGNITTMGADVFAYDKVSRIVESTVSGQDQDYTYDAYGNIKTITTEGSLRNVPVDPSTNRLDGYDYDNRGNLRFWNAQECYEYDEFNQIKQVRSGSCSGPVDRAHVYTADGERILTVHGVADFDFTLRDLDGKVLRKFRTDPETETTSISLDNIWLEGRLVGFIDEDGEEVHAHLDHLGTPRLHTDAAGAKLSEHDYFPFGLEITDPDQDEIPMKFTGHERDRSAIGTAAELDYMHARYYSAFWGRFTSVDPVDSSHQKVPQTYNRYSYTIGNPIRNIDPDGRAAVGFTGLSNNLGGVTQAVDSLIKSTGLLGQVRHYSWGNTREATRFIEHEMRMHPNKILAIFGHSLGGRAALAVARQLSEQAGAPDVDLLITIDAAPKRGETGQVAGNREVVPSNVKIAINFFQTGALLPGSELIAQDPSKTEVFNIEIGVGHGKIDEAVAGAIISFIIQQAEEGTLDLKEGLQVVQGEVIHVRKAPAR